MTSIHSAERAGGSTIRSEELAVGFEGCLRANIVSLPPFKRSLEGVNSRRVKRITHRQRKGLDGLATTVIVPKSFPGDCTIQHYEVFTR